MATTFASYFRYHLKSKLRWLIVLTAIALFFVLMFSITGQRTPRWEYIEGLDDVVLTGQYYYDSYIGWPVTMLILCAYILPVTEFAFMKKRRNLDCLYALPISRSQLGSVHYLTGLICLVVPYVSAYLANFLLMLRYPEGFYYLPLVEHFLLNLIVGITVYSIMVFVFNQANTVIDGIIFMALWSFAFTFVLSAVDSLFSYISMWLRLAEEQYDTFWTSWYLDTGYGTPFGFSMNNSWIYAQIIEKAKSTTREHIWDVQAIVSSVVWPVLGAAAAVGFFRFFGQRRAEKTEEISDSWFGFKLLIPVYAFCSLIALGGITGLFDIVFVFVGYVVYRRGFRLKKSDWIIMGIYFNIFILFSVFMLLLEL